MNKNLSITMLLDFYAELLTEKQRTALTLYYCDDCSLSEIAEYMNISRQGVRDFIKRGETLITEYEEKLGLVERFKKISNLIKELSEVIENETVSEKSRKIIADIIDNL